MDSEISTYLTNGAACWKRPIPIPLRSPPLPPSYLSLIPVLANEYIETGKDNRELPLHQQPTPLSQHATRHL